MSKSSPRRHMRVPDVRPLDRFRSLKIKLGVLVTATVSLAAFVTWLGLHNELGPRWTFPLAITLSLVLTQLLARGMTSPLRHMTLAARAMADGDYSQRVRETSSDEVGQLAHAFNRMAEDLESEDVMRRELVANVSHELRTPVSALQAQLENLVDGVVEPTPAALKSAFDQTERLGRLVSYLLDLSRLEAGASALHLEEISVESFFADAVGQAELVAPGKQLQFQVQVDPPELTAVVDPERFSQIITNLLNNAIRHSPALGTITVSARAASDTIIIDVADEGPGIAPADRDRVFERFQRGNRQQSSRSSGGTGLGLAIVRWAVDLHNGRIEVANTPHGATLRLWLPRQRDGYQNLGEPD